MKEKPIFVVGSPRSGTTLLRFVLSSHPRIYIPSETGFIPHLNLKPDRRMSRQQCASLLEQIAALNREWAGLVSDVSRFHQSLPEPTAAHFLDALYRRQIAASGAARWGDKTPAYVLHLPLLHAIFPEAQFVHMIRDGRDVTLSALRKWGTAPYMDAYYLLRNWAEYVKRGRAAGRRLGPAHYLEIRYEDLVGRPDTEIERLCAFLDEQLDPAMLEHDRLARDQIGPAGHVEVRNPITKTSAYRWKREMSPFELKLADHLAGEMLATFGYERVPVGGFSPGERVRVNVFQVKYVVTRGMRHLLTRAGWLSLNRRKRG